MTFIKLSADKLTTQSDPPLIISKGKKKKGKSSNLQKDLLFGC